MNFKARNTAWFLFGSSMFLVVFACLSLLQLKRTNVRDADQITTHAAIIADDVWQLNGTGTKSYLQLAVQAGHYKVLAVTLEEGDTFIRVTSPQLSGIDKLFLQLNIIRTKELSSPVVYEGQRIGVLEGEKYVRIIFPLLNIFIFLLFVALVGIFIVYLSYNRKLLESQVLERTKAFHESEGRFHELVNLLPEMVLETDERGRITYANEMALERFDISDLETSGFTCSDVIVFEPKEQGEESFVDWTKDQSRELTEYTARGADGEAFPVLIRSAPIFTNNHITGARLVIVDITDRCALERQLQRDQKMKTIGMMAGGVAHDLNNILSGMVNYPELILLKLPEDSKLRGDVESIMESGWRAAEIVADLLTVARGVAASKEVASLNELTRDYLESPDFMRVQSLYPELSCHADLDPEICNVLCSAIHVRKCLMNLVNNAAEAMDGAGHIRISTSGQQVDKAGAKHESIEQGTYAVLTVHDAGPGVPPRDIDHIFEPFYTKKKMGMSGTGLGLAVVWNTMQDHGGAVKVDNEKDGTAFTLYFPCVGREIDNDLSPATDWMEFEGRGETILVVDDESHQQDIASQLLTSLGYEVNAVSSGEEAIEYLAGSSVDLLVLDMVMEPGLNGRQTFEEILQRHPSQKAVIVTGFSESEDVRTVLQLGAGGMISKPYAKEQLGKAVHKVLNQR